MINTVYKQLTDWCKSRSIGFDLLRESKDIRAIHVAKEQKNKAQHIGKYTDKIANEFNVNSHYRSDRHGILVIIAENKITDDIINSIVDDYQQSHDEFCNRLEEALVVGEDADQYRWASAIHKRRSNAVNAFPNTFTDRMQNTPYLLEKPKNINQKIDEAFQLNEVSPMAGIATPTSFQPADGIKALTAALTAMGLMPQLKKMGIKWHLAKPGKHTITFVKNNVPILQKDTSSLADKKELEDIINKLQSVALGQAPEAGKVEADRAKKREADARAIADRFAGNQQPEQPIQ